MIDDAFGPIDPLTFVIEAGAQSDGTNDGIGGDRNDHGLLDERRERETYVRGALGEESGGVGVAIDRGVMCDSIFLRDEFGAVPVQEFALDFGAFGMPAGGAFSVMPKAGLGLPPGAFLMQWRRGRQIGVRFVKRLQSCFDRPLVWHIPLPQKANFPVAYITVRPYQIA